MSGIAAEQIANDPDGRLFIDQTERGIRGVLASIRSRDNVARSAPTPSRRRGRQPRIR